MSDSRPDTATDPTAWRHEPWRRPVRFVLMALIRFYQMWISPAFPPSCRFYPSCSAYAMTAVDRFGPFTGLRLAAWRLARCNPWNLGGVDHVPDRGPDGRPARPQNDDMDDGDEDRAPSGHTV